MPIFVFVSLTSKYAHLFSFLSITGIGPNIRTMSFLFVLSVFINRILFFKFETPCTLSTLLNVQEIIISDNKIVKNFLKMNILNIYNKTLVDARNPAIFENYIDDNLNNKLLIFLIFLSKIFNKIEKKDESYQKLFDYIFNRIETDLRELGYGDMSVNKKMKVIVTKFYSILLDFKDYSKKTNNDKSNILRKYFVEVRKIDDFSVYLINYLSIDNV